MEVANPARRSVRRGERDLPAPRPATMRFRGPPSIALSRLALALLLGALALRLALVPLTVGNDFWAYQRLALLTLRGQDVYALSLSGHLRVLSWAYFPLCLHMFAFLEFLTLHTGWSFVVLGKLPVVVADLAVGTLLYAALCRLGQTTRTATLGMALYLFNPLVLYNGVFLGRFDAIALALVLLALYGYRTRLFAPVYALAIAAKTFPLFLLPLLALGRNRQKPRRLVLAGALVPILALPYTLSDPRGLFSFLLYKRPSLGRLSWYDAVLQYHLLPASRVMALAHAGTLLFPLAVLLFVASPLYVKCAQCFTLFLLLNQIVYEQYLLWPLPFLIIVGLHERNRWALWLAALMTVAGMLENEHTWERHDAFHYHLVPTPWPLLNIVLAISILAFLRSSFRTPALALGVLRRLRIVLRHPAAQDVIDAPHAQGHGT